MKKIIFIVSLILLSCNVQADVRAAIEARNLEWTEAYNRGGFATVMAIYDEGFLVIPSGGEPMGDRAAMESSLKAGAAMLQNMRFETQSVDVVGDRAYELGRAHYDVHSDDDTVTSAADKYLVIWKKGTDGVWYYHFDAWWAVSD
jgi:ketosteroid isomerase-like protein